MKSSDLIFLISLPRSGSTLLQKIMSGHGEVFSYSESWLMLPFISAFKKNDCSAKYDFDTGSIALEDFTKLLKQPVESVNRSLERLGLELYGNAVKTSGKKFFLDKTPRYHLYLPELAEIFPDAKFVVLQRNPLAVITSMYSTWCSGAVGGLMNNRIDLVDGVTNINSFVENHDCIQVRYEDFLLNPVAETNRVMGSLGFESDDSLVNYGNENTSQDTWSLGDQKTVNKAKKPLRSKVDQWKQDIDSPQILAVCKEYLEFIGKESFEDFGYSFTEARSALNEIEAKFDEVVEPVSIAGLPAKVFFDQKHMLQTWQRDKLKLGLTKDLEGISEILVGHLTDAQIKLQELEVLRNKLIALMSADNNFVVDGLDTLSSSSLMDKLEHELIRIRKETVGLRVQFGEVNQEHDNLSVEMAQVRKENAELLVLTEEMQFEAEELTSMLSASNIQVNDLAKMYQENLSDLNKQTNENARGYEAKIDRLESQLFREQKLNDNLVLNEVEYNAAIDKIKESTEVLVSTRIWFSPLRKIKFYRRLLNTIVKDKIFLPRMREDS